MKHASRKINQKGAEKIGEDRYESIEYTPGKLFVKVTIVPKYKVKLPGDNDNTIKIISAPAPVRPLGKSLAGASLLAQSLVDKYADHLPTNRQQTRFVRDGTNILKQYDAGLECGSHRFIKSIESVTAKK